jgi:FtsH-binding integral membrane protein
MRDLNSKLGAVYVDKGLRKHMISVFNRMFVALGVTGSVALVCSSSQAFLRLMISGRLSYLLLFATLGITMYISARIRKISSQQANALFWVYSVLIGASLSPIFAIYTGESIANAFFSAAVFFGGMSLYGYVTKRDLTNIGSFLIVGAFAICITSLVNHLLLKSTALEMGVSALAIVVFSGLTAYDIQRIKEFYHESLDEEALKKGGILGALNLYLDFLNLFVAMLRLIGNRRN